MPDDATFLALAARADELLAATTRRDNAIREAAADGFTLPQIAAEVLLSPEQLRQIIGPAVDARAPVTAGPR